jgi:pimeloyl-ACP methyl ester carboxylesterase
MDKQYGRYLTAAGFGLAAGWVGWKIGKTVRTLASIDVAQSVAALPDWTDEPLTVLAEKETRAYTMRHTREGGIERIVYTPKKRRFQTPIVMQHGMWHGAWTWQGWQELFAIWGWESHAHSLPGHAGSPEQRPVPQCTLDYYLRYLRAEIERMPVRPVLMGHSMGGALTQWYLKYVGDDLAAAVLVAPWESHHMLLHGIPTMLRLDPVGLLLLFVQDSATPMMRTPQVAANALISDTAVIAPSALYEQLGPESALVLFQHNPPFWKPADNVQTPMLWLAGEVDAFFSEPAERRSAAHYGADYRVIEGAGHNIMMERNFLETAEMIHEWLSSRCQ